jgi:hypothetical protein
MTAFCRGTAELCLLVEEVCVYTPASRTGGGGGTPAARKQELRRQLRFVCRDGIDGETGAEADEVGNQLGVRFSAKYPVR